MAFSPKFHFDAAEQHYVGDQFWDGRAATLEEQAKRPFLNPLAMANDSAGGVVAKVQATSYAALFREVFGADALDVAAKAYDHIQRTTALSHERTPMPLARRGCHSPCRRSRREPVPRAEGRRVA